MAITQMLRAQTKDSERNNFPWEFEETITSASNGIIILVPSGIHGISVSLIPTIGSGKVQTTTDSVATIREGNENWIDWPHGVVSIYTQDVTSPVSAIRQVNISGTTKIAMRAQ